MQPQVLDESVRFSCGSCTFCCDQAWHTLVEPEKAHALDRHDFSAYPQLAGKPFYDPKKTKKEGMYRLAKGEGTRCLFLDTEGLCIIHKELGPQAKPHMCRQFPFLSAPMPSADRVSVNYGCPAVQSENGVPLSEHASDIATIVPRRECPPHAKQEVALDATCSLTLDEDHALFERASALFDDQSDEDLWSRFARLLTLLVAVREHKRGPSEHGHGSEDLADLLRSGQPLPGTPEVPQICAFPKPAHAPMPARFLFAATLCPDTVPRDSVDGLGFKGRVTLIPKLLTLATLTGTYASSVLQRNAVIHEILAYPVDDELDGATTRLLTRYFRSRLWQRFLAGTRLNVIAGVHQHIHDFNAILFLVRAEAQHTDAHRITEAMIRKALTGVEFHFANQARLFDHSLKKWLRKQLQQPELAVASLRLLALKRPPSTDLPPVDSTCYSSAASSS